MQESGAFYNLIYFVTGGLILSLIYHPHMHPYGMYLAVAMMHFPCYGIFALIVRMKHLWLSRSFPGSSRNNTCHNIHLGMRATFLSSKSDFEDQN
ncbi:hypothetical protein CR513_38558, partial [Mucuna pruriens]